MSAGVPLRRTVHIGFALPRLHAADAHPARCRQHLPVSALTPPQNGRVCLRQQRDSSVRRPPVRVAESHLAPCTLWAQRPPRSRRRTRVRLRTDRSTRGTCSLASLLRAFARGSTGEAHTLRAWPRHCVLCAMPPLLRHRHGCTRVRCALAALLDQECCCHTAIVTRVERRYVTMQTFAIPVRSRAPTSAPPGLPHAALIHRHQAYECAVPKFTPGHIYISSVSSDLGLAQTADREGRR